MSIRVIICEGEEKIEEREYKSLSNEDDKDYGAYITQNGYHFSSFLADYVSRRMKNMDKSNHHWTTEDVKNAFTMYGLTKSADCTWGDVAYAANMAYADYFGILLKTEKDCLMFAVADVNDIDGYEGKQFCRWKADVEHIGVPIRWEDFV